MKILRNRIGADLVVTLCHSSKKRLGPRYHNGWDPVDVVAGEARVVAPVSSCSPCVYVNGEDCLSPSFGYVVGDLTVSMGVKLSVHNSCRLLSGEISMA